MKVCFLINQIHEGGAERVVCSLSNYLINSGIDVHLITTLKFTDEYKLDDSVKRYVLSPFLNTKNRLSKNILIKKLIRQYCLNNQIDCICSFMAESNFRAISSCKRITTKIIISIRNDPAHEYQSFLYKILSKHLFPKADAIVFQTDDAKNSFNSKISKLGTIIENPINEAFLTQKIGKGLKRKDFVTSGRLAEQKNHSVLIEAFSLISKKTDANLYIYGDGPLREILKKKINDLSLNNRVFLMGQCCKLEEELQKYKTFVLSSNYEGMPNSLMEAMALGLDCISTDCPCGGPRFLFDNNKYGRLCIVNDKEKLANLMLLSANENESQDKIDARIRRANEFSIDRIGRKWIGLLNSIVKPDI